MDSVLEAALRQPSPVKVTLVKIVFASGTMRLCDGGFVQHAGELYLSSQSPFGVLDQVGEATEGGSGTTTRLEISLNPESPEAVAAMAHPSNQGGLVQWWEGAVNESTGLLIGEPKLKFEGFYDKARFSVGKSWSLTVECITESARQLIPNTDWRLNNSTQQRAWSGDMGCANVTNLDREEYWRTEAKTGAIVTGGGSGSGGVADIGFNDTAYLA